MLPTDDVLSNDAPTSEELDEVSELNSLNLSSDRSTVCNSEDSHSSENNKRVQHNYRDFENMKAKVTLKDTESSMPRFTEMSQCMKMETLSMSCTPNSVPQVHPHFLNQNLTLKRCSYSRENECAC